jgi:hypothetical protein
MAGQTATDEIAIGRLPIGLTTYDDAIEIRLLHGVPCDQGTRFYKQAILPAWQFAYSHAPKLAPD